MRQKYSSDIIKPVKTKVLQDLENKPLHAQKGDSTVNTSDVSNRKLVFDGTQDSPIVYDQNLEVPAFIRKQQD